MLGLRLPVYLSMIIPADFRTSFSLYKNLPYARSVYGTHSIHRRWLSSFVRSKTCRRAVTVKFVVSRCAFCKLRKDFGFFCSVNHLNGGRVTQITTQRAHQFRALARRERKSFNRKYPKMLKNFALSTMSIPFDEKMNIWISYI